MLSSGSGLFPENEDFIDVAIKVARDEPERGCTAGIQGDGGLPDGRAVDRMHRAGGGEIVGKVEEESSIG